MNSEDIEQNPENVEQKTDANDIITDIGANIGTDPFVMGEVTEFIFSVVGTLFED